MQTVLIGFGAVAVYVGTVLLIARCMGLTTRMEREMHGACGDCPALGSEACAGCVHFVDNLAK